MKKTFELQKLQRISGAFSIDDRKMLIQIDYRNLLQIFLNRKLEHQSHCFQSSIFIILVRIKAWLSFFAFLRCDVFGKFFPKPKDKAWFQEQQW